MDDKQEQALKLFQSVKGRLLLGKALALAVKELEKKYPDIDGYIDIIDMELLGEQLFNPYYKMYYRGIDFK